VLANNANSVICVHWCKSKERACNCQAPMLD
jgi:hypothetical protein